MQNDQHIISDQNQNTNWLNRNVFAFGLTSFLSDFSHEMATSVLPQFMQSINASAAILGFIEGVADAVSSFVKLGSGYHSDRIGHRKAWVVFGYALTGVAAVIFAYAFIWPLVLLGRVISWLGRGIRGPLRDAMLADSVLPHQRGKAFGFHRAYDTAGAIAGPLAAFWLLSLLGSHPAWARAITAWLPGGADAAGWSFRVIFILTLIPGLLSAAAIAFLVTEKRRNANRAITFWGTLKGFPKDYRRFLFAVLVFGIADFAPTLMILRASTSLAPSMGLLQASRMAALLYMLRNITYAIASFPIGALSNRFARTRYLSVGYAIAVLTFLGFALAVPNLWWFVVCFSLAGIFIAWEDTIEGVAVRDYVDTSVAGTAYGVLGVANGIGDFISSIMVGLLWTVFGPLWAFMFAAIVGLSGTVLMASVPARTHKA